MVRVFGLGLMCGSLVILLWRLLVTLAVGGDLAWKRATILGGLGAAAALCIGFGAYCTKRARR